MIAVPGQRFARLHPSPSLEKITAHACISIRGRFHQPARAGIADREIKK